MQNAFPILWLELKKVMFVFNTLQFPPEKLVHLCL